MTLIEVMKILDQISDASLRHLLASMWDTNFNWIGRSSMSQILCWID